MADRLPVAVDAMGGDDAPAVVVAGARIAAERYGLPVLLVGDPARLGDTGAVPVLAASQVVMKALVRRSMGSIGSQSSGEVWLVAMAGSSLAVARRRLMR